MPRRLDPRRYPDYTKKSVVDRYMGALDTQGVSGDNSLHWHLIVPLLQQRPRRSVFLQSRLQMRAVRSRTWS